MEIDQNFIAIPTLIVLVIAVIAIIVPLINSYRNVVKDAMKNIQEIEKNLVSRVDVLENKMRELSTNLEYVSYRTLYTELTVQSTQAWNESKLITHIKKDFEIIDIALRNNRNEEECKGIIGFKRYAMAGVICSIVIDGKGVDKDDVKIVSDARRTVNRIMELIKSQKNLTAKMKRIGFFEDCNELEVAIENLFMDIERGESEVKIPNLTKIKVMAER